MTARPIVWSVAGSDSGGGAGIQADLKALEAFDVHACTAIAALTAQNSRAVERVDAVLTLDGPVTMAALPRIVHFAAMSRLPAVYGSRDWTEAGGLMSYGTDERDLFRRSAAYVHRILAGARPGDLPVGPPTRFELVINGKTARSLGLAIPASLLRRADLVIE